MLGVFLMILTTLSGCCSAPQYERDNGPKPAFRIFELPVEVGGQQYACKVMVNQYAAMGGPALLFLHGAGECGADGLRQTLVGLPPAIMKNPERWPFVLIMPQKPQMMSEWEDHDDAIMQILDEAAKLGFYDPDRLAITGLSQGGHGTITIASMHPDRFKAAAPVCAYVERRVSIEGERIQEIPANPDDPAVIEASGKLASLPLWLFHGETDDVVPCAESRSLAAAIDTRGADARYTEFPKTNHNAWDQAYATEELAAWFIEHTKAD